MILTDEEIAEISLSAVTVKDAITDVRAVEAAIMEKLASAELPEPVGAYEKVVGTEIWQGFPSEIVEMQDAYSSDQLRQAYAQGAAAQLSAEPEWYVYRVNNSGWGCVPASYVPHEDVYDEGTLTPLYTRRQA